jgi:hypothetical protein
MMPFTSFVTEFHGHWGDLVSDFFSVGDGPDEFFLYFPAVLEFAPVDHSEASDTDRATFV